MGRSSCCFASGSVELQSFRARHIDEQSVFWYPRLAEAQDGVDHLAVLVVADLVAVATVFNGIQARCIQSARWV